MERLKKLAPPGISVKNELGFYAFGLVIAFLISFAYFIRLCDAASDYYVWSTVSGKIVNPDFVMPMFAELIEGVFTGFVFVSMCSLLLPLYHYFSYSSGGSHALYLIRRLPERGYLAMTCLTLPVLMALASLLIALLLLILYYGIYVLAVPDGHFIPGQFLNLWRF